MSAKQTVDIAICTDRMHFTGMMAAINSIISNAEHPQAVSFHITVGADESGELLALMRKCFPNPSFLYEIRTFRPSPFLEEYIRAGRDTVGAAYTSAVMNFSRFYLAEIYPDLRKIIYLDADVIVQADIAELFQLATLERHACAAVPFATFGTWEEGFDLDSIHLKDFDVDEPIFNGGIFVTDLAKWQDEGILPALEGWMKVHRQSLDDFVFGTQSIMNLAFYLNSQILPREWNVCPLGADETIAERTLREAKILHWAGPRKPWVEDGLYKEYWNRYALVLDREKARRRMPSRRG